MLAANKHALAPHTTSEQAELRQYLTFRVGREVFGIGVLTAREILELDQITNVPMMPASIRGVINLRGSVVPVIDLSARFGSKVTEATKRTCIVIVEIGHDGARHNMGLLVDSVSQVVDIRASEIEPPPSFGAKIRTDFIEGMGKLDGRFVILLDLDHVLSMDELSAIAQASAEEQPMLAASNP